MGFGGDPVHGPAQLGDRHARRTGGMVSDGWRPNGHRMSVSGRRPLRALPTVLVVAVEGPRPPPSPIHTTTDDNAPCGYDGTTDDSCPNANHDRVLHRPGGELLQARRVLPGLPSRADRRR